jgi:hypothetical protein
MQIAFQIRGKQVGLKLDSFPSMLLFALVTGAAIGACFLAAGIALALLAALCIVLGGSLIALGIGFIALILALCAAGFVLWLIAIGLKRIFKEISRFLKIVVLQQPGTPSSPNSPEKDTPNQEDQTSNDIGAAFTETPSEALASPA